MKIKANKGLKINRLIVVIFYTSMVSIFLYFFHTSPFYIVVGIVSYLYLLKVFIELLIIKPIDLIIKEDRLIYNGLEYKYDDYNIFYRENIFEYSIGPKLEEKYYIEIYNKNNELIKKINCLLYSPTSREEIKSKFFNNKSNPNY